MRTNKTRREQIAEALKSKEYRDEYIGALISVGLPAQIREMRLARGWNQERLGERAGMRQSQISRFERKGCEAFTLSSLLSLASAFDVGLKVRFVPFSELVHEDAHPERYDLNVPSFEEDTRINNDSAEFVMDYGKAPAIHLTPSVSATLELVVTTPSGLPFETMFTALQPTPERVHVGNA